MEIRLGDVLLSKQVKRDDGKLQILGILGKDIKDLVDKTKESIFSNKEDDYTYIEVNNYFKEDLINKNNQEKYQIIFINQLKNVDDLLKVEGIISKNTIIIYTMGNFNDELMEGTDFALIKNDTKGLTKEKVNKRKINDINNKKYEMFLEGKYLILRWFKSLDTCVPYPVVDTGYEESYKREIDNYLKKYTYPFLVGRGIDGDREWADLKDIGAITLLGGSGSGKTWKLFNYILGINIQNKYIPNEVDVYNYADHTYLNTLPTTRVSNNIDNILEDFKKIKEDFLTRDKHSIKKYIVIEEFVWLTLSQKSNLSEKDYKQFKDIFRYLIENAVDKNVTFIILTQRLKKDDYFQKLLIDNSEIFITGSVDILSDFSNTGMKKENMLTYNLNTEMDKIFYTRDKKFEKYKEIVDKLVDSERFYRMNYIGYVNKKTFVQKVLTAENLVSELIDTDELLLNLLMCKERK